MESGTDESVLFIEVSVILGLVSRIWDRSKCPVFRSVLNSGAVK